MWATCPSTVNHCTDYEYMIDLVQERKKMTEKTAGSVKLLPRTGILTACFCCCFVLFLCFGFLCA